MQEKDFNVRILVATILSAVLITAWLYVFKGKDIAQEPKAEEVQQEIVTETKVEEYNTDTPEEKVEEKALDRNEVLKNSSKERISIKTEKLTGSISLKGIKFDDLVLTDYENKLNSQDNVILLSPINTEKAFFADFGWIAADKNIQLPSVDTVWRSVGKELTVDTPIKLSWRNPQGLVFQVFVSVDEDYMFNIKQSVINNSAGSVALIPYGRISKKLSAIPRTLRVLHQGAIGSFNQEVSEVSYKKMKKSGYTFENGFDWAGITDKYWLTAVIPYESIKNNFSTDFKHKDSDYKVEFKGKEIIVNKGKSAEYEYNFFAGAKELDILDKYANKLNIPLFDRTVDFGWFYFLTKPIYLLLRIFYRVIKNFGIAIILLTLVVKGVMFPFAKKSFVSMAKMRKLQPKIQSLKERYKGDKMRINQETMKLYQKEGVNPMSGCLPTFVQIPVFYSLYKVLYVTIDMRHAPFFGYIKDLSAPDPTTIWNLFGLLPFEVGFVRIGLLPCLVSLSMWIQQRLNSQASVDESTKTMSQIMPIMFLFLFSAFPTGLLVYWFFNNTITIGQQYMINRSLKDK